MGRNDRTGCPHPGEVGIVSGLGRVATEGAADDVRPAEQFLACDGDFAWRHEPQANLVALDRQDPDADVVPDDDLFTHFATQDQHADPSMKHGWKPITDHGCSRPRLLWSGGSLPHSTRAGIAARGRDANS